MASKTDVWEIDLLNLLFQNVDATGIGDAGGLRGAVGAGSFVSAAGIRSVPVNTDITIMVVATSSTPA